MRWDFVRPIAEGKQGGGRCDGPAVGTLLSSGSCGNGKEKV